MQMTGARSEGCPRKGLLRSAVHLWSVLSRLGGVATLALSTVVAAFAEENAWAGDPPPLPGDIVAEDADDFDGDHVPDDVTASPFGAGGVAGCLPGEVYVSSGTDGELIVRFRGRTCNDQFGHGLAIIRDFNLDGFEDLLIGAPGDEDGHAFGFLGPFRCPSCAVQLDAEDADFVFFSPNNATYDFGERVSPVSDLNGDGIPELRFRAWFESAPGVEQSRTYIASGVDGFPLLVVTGNAPFDPWATQTGDVDGDGDVDQLDLDLILDNQGMTSGATAFDGDVDGDQDVDMADHTAALGFFGDNRFDAFVGIGHPETGGEGPGGGGPVWICQTPTPSSLHCVTNCWGYTMELPGNVDPLCEMVTCQAWCGFSLEDHGQSIMPIDSYNDIYELEAVNGLELEGTQWTVLEGGPLIQVISGYVGKTFRFHPLKKGVVHIQATNTVCEYSCTQTAPEQFLEFLDSDHDTLPDAWENLWGLDSFDPTDAHQDNDADGLNNLFEFAYGGNPFVPDAPGDSDGDAIPDPCEQQMGTDPFNPNSPAPLLDTDFDGVLNAYEICVFHTSPFDADTDDDGMPDGWEIQYALDPVHPFDAMQDGDGDDIPNILEYLYGSSPIDSLSGAPVGLDADGDGYIDWLEDMYGTNPASAQSMPSPSQLTINPDDMLFSILNGIIQHLQSPAIEMCVGDCFLLHATGWATSWTVVQGAELLDEVIPDSLASCISPKWCITGPGDIVIMSSTPGPGGPVIGFVHIHAVDHCDDPCKLEITGPGGSAPPQMACIGEMITLSAAPDPRNGPHCQCTGDYEWEILNSTPGAAVIVGSTFGPGVLVWISMPGEIHVSATQGDCAGGVEIAAVKIDLDADSDRNGSVDSGSDDSGEDIWTYGEDGKGAIILFNNDDDDGDHAIDSSDEQVNGAVDVDDLAPLAIRSLGANLPEPEPEGWKVRLTVTENGDRVRIFDARDADATMVIPNLLGEFEHDIPLGDVEGLGEGLEYGIEALAYPGWPYADFDGLVTIKLQLVDPKDDIACEDVVQVRVAPWLMPSHADEVTTVYVADVFGPRPETDPGGAAPAFPNRLNTALGGTGLTATIIHSGDPWPQDQYEVGYHSMPGGHWSSVLLNSPRFGYDGESLRLYAQHTLLGDDFGLYGTPLDPGDWTAPASSYDSFGNLEAFPPHSPPAPQQPWPSGHVYHGSGMQGDLLGFLAGQHVQGHPPTTYDTSWLLVGHVDEFMTIQATGPNTFRVILASPQMGIAILDQLALAGFVFQHGQLWDKNAVRTAAELLTDPPATPGVTLRVFNQNLQGQINNIRTALQGFGITDFVEVPAYFISQDWSMGGALSASGPAQSMLPDMINMLNVNGTFIVPDPNPHSGIQWPGGGGDPFKAAFTNAIGAGTTIRWIDCLEYHWGVGEVHCGTNVRRTPRPEIREWWLVQP
jgi:protein-arginine deiminase